MSKRKYASRREGIMYPKNGGSFIQEDWGSPALTPRGVHEMAVDPVYAREQASGVGDLYEQVTKGTREDLTAFKRLRPAKQVYW